MNKTVNSPLPYNCAATGFTEDQILEGERNNLEFVKAIANELESEIQEEEYLPRRAFLNAQPHKIITVLVQNAYDSIQRADRYLTPSIEIRIEKNDCKFTLSVKDNGTGFTTNNSQYDGCVPFGGHGSGLDAVENLVNSVNGNLTHENNTIGATVSIEIPII